MNQLPFLILDCYYDEKGATPNFRALLNGASSVAVRLVREPAPQDLGKYRGILITGSKANIPAPEPWMENLFRFSWLLRGVLSLHVIFCALWIAASLGTADARGQALPVVVIELDPS